MSRHLATGQRGEDLASAYLAKQGMTLLERNVTTPFGEIDLICLEGDEVVFVEVKTRAGSSFGGPRGAINLEKRRRISKSALSFLADKGWEDRSARFDFLGIILDGPTPRFDHLINAFDLTQ